jgi:hypothetical protein
MATHCLLVSAGIPHATCPISNDFPPERTVNLKAILFISHAWDHEDHYNELVEILNSITELVWENVSITQGKAIEIATGEKEAPQRQQFLLERSNAVSSSLSKIYAELRQLREDLAEIRKNYSNMEEYKYIDIRIKRAFEKIAEPSFVTTIKSLQKQKSEGNFKYRGVDVDAAILNAEREIQRLTDSTGPLEVDAERLERESKGVDRSLRELQNGLMVHGFLKESDPRKHLFSTSPNLALAIHNRIASSEAVFVIAYPNSAYRTWLEFEYQTAFALRKPFFGLIRDDITDRLPADLSQFGMRPVRWNHPEICEVLEEICKTPKRREHRNK